MKKNIKNNEKNKNEKKSKTKLFVLIALLTLIAVTTSSFAIYTYAKYISLGSQNATAKVSKWSIKVNSADITETGSTSLGTVSLISIPNSNVVSGTIAPQSGAYAVYELDPTGTQVSFNYKFSIGTITSSDNSSIPTGFAISGVKYCKGSSCDASDESKTGTTWNDVTVSGSDYIGSVDLPSTNSAMTSNEKITIKVFVSWSDDETGGASNQDTVDDVNHTSSGVAAPSLTLPIQVTVYQKIN